MQPDIEGFLRFGLILFAGLVIGIAFLWALSGLSALRRRTLAGLRAMSTEELEKQTFDYPSGYFQYIGESNPAVIRFREIVEARDLSALSREWKSLERDFRALEHKAGHSGRPLIMDYFFWYDLNIKVLLERRAGGPPR